MGSPCSQQPRDFLHIHLLTRSTFPYVWPPTVKFAARAIQRCEPDSSCSCRRACSFHALLMVALGITCMHMFTVLTVFQQRIDVLHMPTINSASQKENIEVCFHLTAKKAKQFFLLKSPLCPSTVIRASRTTTHCSGRKRKMLVKSSRSRNRSCQVASRSLSFLFVMCTLSRAKR